VRGYEIPQGETFNYIEGNGGVAATALVTFVLVYALVSRAGHAEILVRSP